MDAGQSVRVFANRLMAAAAIISRDGQVCGVSGCNYDEISDSAGRVIRPRELADPSCQRS
jgi:hypothetical protein